MADFGTSKARFMGFSIPSSTDNEVVPIIGGAAYFARLKAKIGALGTGDTSKQFIYIAGWWLDPDLSLDGPSGGVKLIDLLKQKSHAGVDVRVLGWVLAPETLSNPQVQANDAGGYLRMSHDNIKFVNAIRTEPTLPFKACLNILSHPAGAVHMKFVLIGDGTQTTAYTGGLDLQSGRYSSVWHDVQAQAVGSVTQGCFEAFRTMWNEIRSRKPVALSAQGSTSASHSTSMPDLPARTVSTPSTSQMSAQSLRTLPQFNFYTGRGSDRLPKNTPLSYAPNGLFEIRNAWQQAVEAAQNYIYIEDQAFYSGEVFDWVNKALKTDPNVRAVFLIGAEDPNDPPNPNPDLYLGVAINNHLLAGLTPAQRDRIAFCRHLTRVVHTKSTIVDDCWGLIGSANAMRRSLYTDMEHSIAFMDPDSVAVSNYRSALWHTHIPTAPTDVAGGLSAWFALPIATGAKGQSGIKRLSLPPPVATLSQDDIDRYEDLADTDSRNPWGQHAIAAAIRNMGGVSGAIARGLTS